MKNTLKTTAQIGKQTEQDELFLSYQDQLVSFQTHSQCTNFKFQSKAAKSKLFKHAHRFVLKLGSDEGYYNKMRQFLIKPNQQKQNINPDDSFVQKTEPFQNMSFKKVQTGTTRKSFNSSKTPKAYPIQTSQRKAPKRISIIIFENQDQYYEFNNFSSESITTASEIKTFHQIKLPSMKFTQQFVKQVYQAPSPFLINLSICLLLKFCISRNAKPQIKEMSWLLAVSTIVAFKIYYDENLEGMFECFESVLKIQKHDLVDLERFFLDTIDYNVNIKNIDYQYVLSKFVEFDKNEQKLP